MGRAFLNPRKARKLKRWGNMARTFTRIGKGNRYCRKSRWPRPSKQYPSSYSDSECQG